MSCFFGCLRIKQHHRGRPDDFLSKSISSNHSVPAVSRSKLASVLSYEENGSSPQQSAPRDLRGRFENNRSDEEIKDEAQVLKNCNASEIRKVSGSRRTSLKKLLRTEALEQTDASSNRLNEDSNTQQTSSVCYKLDEQRTLLHDASYSASDISANSTLLQDVKDAYGIDSSPFQSKSKLDSTRSKHSPFPTPLKVTDEMRTPEALSSATKGDGVAELNARMRLDYAHPVLNPIKNSSEWKALKASFHHRNASDELNQQMNSMDGQEDPKGSHLTDTCTNGESRSPESPSSAVPALNNEEPQIVVSSLSQWLRPKSPRNHQSHNSASILRDRPRSVRSTDEDRPIIGMVAAHWSEDEPSNPSPVWWDGNGIPNSTNKYKEDQTVSYYATSFEERLEKALSEESLLTQRKLPDAKRIKDEGEEDDTAASRNHI